MIDAKQIPPEVIKAWHDHCADNTVTTYEEAFAAALNAWPGSGITPKYAHPLALPVPASIFLPLSKEGE